MNWDNDRANDQATGDGGGPTMQDIDDAIGVFNAAGDEDAEFEPWREGDYSILIHPRGSNVITRSFDRLYDFELYSETVQNRQAA
jgi:hypothetical protein